LYGFTWINLGKERRYTAPKPKNQSFDMSEEKTDVKKGEEE